MGGDYKCMSTCVHSTLNTALTAAVYLTDKASPGPPQTQTAGGEPTEQRHAPLVPSSGLSGVSRTASGREGGGGETGETGVRG